MVLSKAPKGVLFYVIVLAFQVPTILLAVLAEVYPNVYLTERPVFSTKFGEAICQFKDFGYVISLYGFQMLHIAFLIILNVYIARVRAAFNEFQEIRVGLCIIVVNTIFNFIAIEGFHLESTISGKTAITIFQLISELSLVWVTIFDPLFGL
jgi:hypothetical protein